MVFEEIPYVIRLDRVAFDRWWSGLPMAVVDELGELADALDGRRDGSDFGYSLQSLMLEMFGQRPSSVGVAAAGVVRLEVAGRALAGVEMTLDLDPSFDTSGVYDGVYAVASLWFPPGASAEEPVQGGALQVIEYESHPSLLVPQERGDARETAWAVLQATVGLIDAELDRRRGFARRVGAAVGERGGGGDEVAGRGGHWHAPVIEAVAPNGMGGEGTVEELAEYVSRLPRERLQVRSEGFDPADDNRVRANWGARALVDFGTYHGSGELCEECSVVLVGLIANLLHLADGLGSDAQTVLRRAVVHYDEEVRGA